jgi:hypothetical protein
MHIGDDEHRQKGHTGDPGYLGVKRDKGQRSKG